MPREIASSHFSPDTVDFIRLLRGRQVRYLIVGGEAVIYYGYARLTGDVDFWYDPSEDNTERLFGTLQEFWGGDVPGVDSAEDLRKEDQVLQFGLPPNRIDLLTRISGVGFDEAWEGRVEVSLVSAGKDPVLLNYIGLSELIKNKKASGRPKDLEDVSYLRASGRSET